jgi:hypothetical protein
MDQNLMLKIYNLLGWEFEKLAGKGVKNEMKISIKTGPINIKNKNCHKKLDFPKREN